MYAIHVHNKKNQHFLKIDCWERERERERGMWTFSELKEVHVIKIPLIYKIKAIKWKPLLWIGKGNTYSLASRRVPYGRGMQMLNILAHVQDL